MITFEGRTGPSLDVDYPRVGVPDWYRDAKLGVFIHWGIYSVPAFAVVHGERRVAPEDAYAQHEYAEWYANTVRIANSPTQRHHVATYGTGTSYEDLADAWHVPETAASALVEQVLRSGARFIVPTTKHHDGFCLWDTQTTLFNSARRGPRRDLIAELHHATIASGARFGVYFSGALDWHVSDCPPITSNEELFAFRRNDEAFARYAARQLDELIERFSPAVVWNDIDWPDAGKGPEEFGVAALWRRYLDAVPDGLVNDRWGVPAHGVLTREYTDVDDVLDQGWESTRGLGRSFGYNRAEDGGSMMSGAELIAHFVDVVAKNGNLLINVGPRADGSVPNNQVCPLVQLGDWLSRNGESIFDSRPWRRAADGPVRYTTTPGTVWCHALEPASGELRLPPELADATSVRWLGGGEEPVIDAVARVPDALRSEPVASCAVSARGR